jgi:choline dehydrogenase-like flavoprotein
LEGPNARAYLQGYVRYAGGATWHWAGICWRITPEDMRLKSLYGVGWDWPFSHDTLKPYYTRAEHAIGVSGPSDPALQWPTNGKRSKPYPMGPIPFGPGEHRFTEAAARIGMINLPAPQARNSGVSFDGRPAAGTTTAFPYVRSQPNTMRRRVCRRLRPRAAGSWRTRSSIESRPARRTQSRRFTSSIRTSARTGRRQDCS